VKNCIIGKSCGASCVASGHECAADLPSKSSKGVVALAKVVVNRTKSGELSEEQADEIIKGLVDNEKHMANFSEFIQSGKATEGELEAAADVLISTFLVTGQDRGSSRTISYEDAVEALKRTEALEKAEQNSIGPDGKFDPTLPGGMKDFVASQKVREVSDEALNLTWNLLPQSVRTALNKKGSVDKENAVFDGEDDQGNPLFGNSGRKERGLMLLRQWMEQGGIDPYTGKKIHLLEAEPEHLFSFAKAWETGVSGDQPNNLLWAARNVNNLKSDMTIGEFRAKLKEYVDMGKDRYDTEKLGPSLEAAKVRAGKRETAEGDIGAAMESVSTVERVSTVKGLIGAYGSSYKYLLRAAGVRDQFSKKTPGGRVKSVTISLDTNVSLFGGKKLGEVTLIAMAASSREQRELIRTKMKQLREERTLSGDQLVMASRSKETRETLQRQKDEAYQTAVEKFFKETVPNMEELLA
jgi:hypothetical protein